MNPEMDRFIRANHRAFRAFVEELTGLFQYQLIEEARPYPRRTKRLYGRGKTGKDAGYQRDVVDSRKLVNSLRTQVVLSDESMVAYIEWTAAHAINVYFGSTSARGLNIPPWPWVDNAIAQLGGKQELVNMFQRHLRKALRKR